MTRSYNLKGLLATEEHKPLKYLPTQSEILEATLAIQSRWSEAKRIRRIVGFDPLKQVETKHVRSVVIEPVLD